MSAEPKVNILMVDDQPENLLALEAILEGLGENLVRASSGEEALRCLLHQDFAVILLDVQMPGMDGFETATLIRSRARSRQTPIIFLTAFSTSDHLMFKGYSLGAVDYLFKPIESSVLTSKVTVFVDLFKKTEAVKRQTAQLFAMNAELRQSEERFQSLSACSPSGIFVIDPSGQCSYTNPRFQAICGLSAEESLAKGWFSSIHPADREKALSSWAIYTRHGRGYCEELRFQTPDGIRWTQVRSSPMVSAHGELMGYVGTIEDITERKQAEAAQEQMFREQVARQEAETANRMKDEFLAVLSHELRTPLNSMLGWARLLRSKKFDEITTARALETIERNAESQSQLIEDILDVSQIIRGKLKLNCYAINLSSIIDAALDSVRPQAEAKSIRIVPPSLEGAIVRVWGDPTRLQQIIWNLLTNAVKFTPQSGQVEVSVTNEPHTPFAQVTVTDTGIGIQPDFLPKVFDRFRQADSTTTRSHSGLGLGLAIVRHLVELHGGTIQADSQGEGQGATFTVRLPIHEEGARARESAKEQESAGAKPGGNGAAINPQDYEDITPCSSAPPLLKGLHVLLVDDEEDNRELVRFILQQQGGIVTSVSTAQQAIEILSQQKPDLLLSDIGMPEMDGCALIRQVRNWLPEQGGLIPAIALTAYAGELNQQKMLAAGFQQHLAKPVEPEVLLSAIVRLVRPIVSASGMSENFVPLREEG
ncbi:hybrid sensor histidine kinase/response regulator [Phormidesmis priestleyi]